MNQMQSYSDVHSSHMSAAATQHAPVSAPPPQALSHYAYPPHSSMMQQPPPQHQYGAATPTYPSYGYTNGVPSQIPASSSVNTALVPSSIQLPAMSSGTPTPSLPGSQSYPSHSFDQTGQVAPPGMKPRVTATLWEDEGSLCFQVEAKGVCVARREDNHMINGTKLLNVAGMTRGRRDGILKSEKTRHVVKIGPMHLKGVWIPFDRALEFANKEKITEQLYPLFVHDIGALLYHPSNQSRTSVGGAAMAAVDRNRRPDPVQTQRFSSVLATSQPPSLQHHHSVNNPIGSAISQPPHTLPSNSTSGRPGIDRAHTFPTPPTSASSIIGMANQGSSYEWNTAHVQHPSGSQPLSADTGLNNARSVPTTPASTPPGAVRQAVSYGSSQAFDGSRPLYSAPPSQPASYTQGQSIVGYRSDGAYPKTEMAPPSRMEEIADEADVKPAESLMPPNNNNDQASASAGVVDGEHEQDNEFSHSNASYHGNRDMTSSPHQTGSGRATPRTAAAAVGPTQWNSGYSTPQRQAQPSSSVYGVKSDSRGAITGNAAQDTFPGPVISHYSTQAYPSSNGVSTGGKRSREEEEQQQQQKSDSYRPDSVQGDDASGLKRRKTMEGGAVGGTHKSEPVPGTTQRTHSGTTQRARR